METNTGEKEWFFYIIQNGPCTYAGVSPDPVRRLRQHNGEIKGGAKYTRSRRPVVLLWSDFCKSRSDACKREIKFKKLKRKEKLLFIETLSK